MLENNSAGIAILFINFLQYKNKIGDCLIKIKKIIIIISILIITLISILTGCSSIDNIDGESTTLEDGTKNVIITYTRNPNTEGRYIERTYNMNIYMNCIYVTKSEATTTADKFETITYIIDLDRDKTEEIWRLSQKKKWEKVFNEVSDYISDSTFYYYTYNKYEFNLDLMKQNALKFTISGVDKRDKNNITTIDVDIGNLSMSYVYHKICNENETTLNDTIEISEDALYDFLYAIEENNTERIVAIFNDILANSKQ